MKKALGIFIALLSLSIVTYAGGKQLKTFNRLMDALIKGENVCMVVHYAKCELEIDGEISNDKIDAIGGMPIDVFEFFARGVVYNEQAFLVASESKLIKNPIGESYVYNYVKLKVFEDNKVEITAEYLKADTFEVVMSETFYGKINDGKNDGGIFFFVN